MISQLGILYIKKIIKIIAEKQKMLGTNEIFLDNNIGNIGSITHVLKDTNGVIFPYGKLRPKDLVKLLDDIENNRFYSKHADLKIRLKNN